jgi:hypothetical protein
MSALNENALTIVASAVVDLQNGDGKTTVYTVPIGKSLIPFCVIIRTPSGSLAGGTDFDIGSGALADTWKQTNDLSAMTAVTDYKVITDLNKHTIEVAGSLSRQRLQVLKHAKKRMVYSQLFRVLHQLNSLL